MNFVFVFHLASDGGNESLMSTVVRFKRERHLVQLLNTGDLQPGASTRPTYSIMHFNAWVVLVTVLPTLERGVIR